MKTLLSKTIYPFLVICLCAVSVFAWHYYYQQGLTLAYNDSMSHLNLSRLIVDNRNPGLAQMGGVWLPMHRILQLPLIWNDTLWKTGLAGSIISMLAYVVSTIMVFRLTKLITMSAAAALIASLAFAFNLNLFYIQTTPLTEPLYLAFFMISVYAFFKWTRTDSVWHLLVLSAATFMQVLTRYDGWFVAITTALIVMGHELFTHKKQFHEAFGKAVLFFAPSLLGIGIWLLWGLVIFNNPLYFASGPYSAKSQQSIIAAEGMLTTQFDIVNSVTTYMFTVFHTVGIYVTALGVIGGIYYCVERAYRNKKEKVWLTLFLFSPILFNIIALFLGFSTINIPETVSGIAQSSRNLYFNTRYGLLALPMMVIGIGLLAARYKALAVLASLFILVQTIATSQDGIITLQDGTIGASAYTDQAAEQYVKNKFAASDTLTVSLAYNNPLTFTIMPSLRNVIHEGTDEWKNLGGDCVTTWTIVRKQQSDPLADLITSPTCTTTYEDEQTVVLQKSQNPLSVR